MRFTGLLSKFASVEYEGGLPLPLPTLSSSPSSSSSSSFFSEGLAKRVFEPPNNEVLELNKVPPVEVPNNPPDVVVEVLVLPNNPPDVVVVVGALVLPNKLPEPNTPVPFGIVKLEPNNPPAGGFPKSGVLPVVVVVFVNRLGADPRFPKSPPSFFSPP